ncbi:hypothetical protein CRG98_022895 [Punica granatum]|uniref:Uncharacterized protein n=1 Tax=Punica granatum TaxID=22663 RepID=A0A2I0JKC1_PUNGR|nr:hypothetical protein CRG98_022895 [Punica granatum]
MEELSRCSSALALRSNVATDGRCRSGCIHYNGRLHSWRGGGTTGGFQLSRGWVAGGALPLRSRVLGFSLELPTSPTQSPSGKAIDSEQDEAKARTSDRLQHDWTQKSEIESSLNPSQTCGARKPTSVKWRSSLELSYDSSNASSTLRETDSRWAPVPRWPKTESLDLKEVVRDQVAGERERRWQVEQMRLMDLMWQDRELKDLLTRQEREGSAVSVSRLRMSSTRWS